MKRTWTIIAVDDVARSCAWYQRLFGQRETAPLHDYFGQILDDDGTVLLCLHQWGEHDHPSLASRERAEPGNGLLLFFRVDDFDACLQRARSSGLRLEQEPHLNPAPARWSSRCAIPTATSSRSARRLRIEPCLAAVAEWPAVKQRLVERLSRDAV